MTASFDDFSQTLAAVQTGIDRGLHTGAQVYVSVGGSAVLDAGAGQANGEAVFDSQTISLWRSAGKPVTAAAILRMLEAAPTGLDTSVATFLPELRDTALSGVTVHQILTHTSGLPLIETGWPQAEWSQILEQISAIEPLESSAAYQPQSTWFLLGEILRRQHGFGLTIGDVLAQSTLRPLGMIDTWCGVPDDRVAALGPRLPQYWVREKGELAASPFGDPPWLTAASPGGNLRGPVSSLGRFYEMLMRGGQAADGTQFLSASTVDRMTSRHRVGTFDETLQHVVDFGLGVIVDSNEYGQATVPYGFGQYCSAASFGHGGSQCAMGFCDPDRQLVVCWAANGFCGEGQHQRRNRAINEAVYQDLGLS